MAKTKAGPGTALATIPKTGIAKQDITEREALQIALRKANVEISDKTLGVLFDEEIEILTDWADKYPEDPELERAWHSALPDFMEFRDTADAGSYQIWHKNQAKETDGPGNGDPVIDAEFQAGP